MDVNRRAELGESPRRASVVEMNVTEEDMLNVASRSANVPQSSNDISKGRLRAGIEQDKPVVRFQRRRRDDARAAELNSIEDMNFQKRGLSVISCRFAVKEAKKDAQSPAAREQQHRHSALSPGAFLADRLTNLCQFIGCR
jgi:hypothetical protein